MPDANYNRSFDWYFIDLDSLDAGNALALSTTQSKNPVVGLQLSEKQPCLNIDSLQVASDSSIQRFPTEKTKYPKKCNETLAWYFNPGVSTDDRYSLTSPSFNFSQKDFYTENNKTLFTDDLNNYTRYYYINN